MQQQSRTLGFVKNLGIYAIGSVGAKLIMFVLVPIYSFFVSPEDLGYYDVCFVTVTFLLPLISMQMRDGAFRFLIDEQSEEQRSKVVSYIIVTLLRNAILTTALSAIITLFWDARFFWYTVAFAIVFSCYEVLIQVIRGCGHTKTFVGVGLISSFSIASITIILMLVCGMGIESLFIGNIAGRILALAIGEWHTKCILRNFNTKIDYSAIGKEIRKFSIPWILTTLAYWILSSSNRFFILNYLGEHDNGLFMVAQKFAMILETLAFIFYQTWQEFAIKNYNTADQNTLYARVLNTYVWALSSMVVLISFGARLLFPYIIGEKFQDSEHYLILLLSSSMLVLLSQFYELGYHCSKDTRKALPGIIIAVIISLAGNFFFVKFFGLYGVLFSLILTYAVLLSIRAYDTRKFFRISLNAKAIYTILWVVISIGIYSFAATTLTTALWLILSACVFLLCTPIEIKTFAQSLAAKFLKINGSHK